MEHTARDRWSFRRHDPADPQHLGYESRHRAVGRSLSGRNRHPGWQIPDPGADYGAAIILALSKARVDKLGIVREINKHPIAPGVTYHSLVGDRGKCDTPKSSDGVVAYWSSHLWLDPRQAFNPAEAGVREKIYQDDFQAN